MPDLSAKRTLVKSPPELWEELSEVERLAKHLGAFGEIRITKLEPQQTVGWEGEHASGTVSIEPAGWGTKVTLRAELAGAAEPRSEDPVAGVLEPEPESSEPVDPEPPSPPPVEQAGEEPEALMPTPLEEPEAPEPPDAGEPTEEQPVRRRRGFWAWLFRPRRAEQHAAEEPVEVPAAEQEAEEPIAEAAAVEEPVPEAAPVEEPVLEAAPVEEPIPEAPPVEEPAEPVSEAPPAEQPEQDGRLDLESAQAVLDETLDALGSAHHRPFSRG